MAATKPKKRRKKNKDEESWLSYLVSEILIGTILRAIGWVIFGIISLFMGD